MPSKPYIRVTNIRGLKRFLLRLLSERYRDEIQSEKVRDLVIICKALLEAFRLSDIEERLETLERIASERSQGGGNRWMT